MAKLKAKIEKLEDVGEALREYYTKGSDGAFYLDADGVDDMPAVVGLKRNSDELKREKDRIAAKAAADTQALESKIADLEKRNKGGQNDERIAELEARVKQVQAAAQQEKAAMEKQLADGLEAQKAFIRKSVISTALADPDVAGDPLFLEHIMAPHLKIEVEHGQPKITVLDGNGNPRIKSTADPVFTAKDLALELKAQPRFGGAFKATTTGGSGAGGNTGSGAGGGKAKGTISRSDPQYGTLLARNADKIAKGEITVTD